VKEAKEEEEEQQQQGEEEEEPSCQEADAGRVRATGVRSSAPISLSRPLPFSLSRTVSPLQQFPFLPPSLEDEECGHYGHHIYVVEFTAIARVRALVLGTIRQDKTRVI
jgi:hypothetical protein